MITLYFMYDGLPFSENDKHPGKVFKFDFNLCCLDNKDRVYELSIICNDLIQSQIV